MKFIDETKLIVSAGKGGNGLVSFRREARVPRGGPDGGDGGNGGNVYFQGDTGMNTLLHLQLNKKINAENGENGKAKRCTGHSGEDVTIRVPIGTMVFEDDNLIADIIDGSKYLIAQGGIGGKGNTKFKSSTNTAPRIADKGRPGKYRKVKLILKVFADIGLIGKPSAGKSTLLSVMSNAKPKIADFDFTTLAPNLGLVKFNDKSFVMADLPGLIEDAHIGKGLGYKFLKHIERAKVLAHVIDFGSINKNPIQDYITINNELKEYKENIDKKVKIIIANKNDNKKIFDQNIKKFKNKYPDLNIAEISALKFDNTTKLKKIFWKLINESKVIPKKINYDETTIEMKQQIIVEKISRNVYQISGEVPKNIYDKIPLNTYENIARFNKSLKDRGVLESIRNHGAKDGDIIRIFSYEFIWGSLW